MRVKEQYWQRVWLVLEVVLVFETTKFYGLMPVKPEFKFRLLIAVGGM